MVIVWCHQATTLTWANANPVVSHHIASLDHNELTDWGRDRMAAINLKCIFFNENIWISLKISLKFVPEVRDKKYSCGKSASYIHIYCGTTFLCGGNGCDSKFIE